MPDPPASPTSPWRDLGLGALLVLPTGFLELGLERAFEGAFAPGVQARLVEAFVFTALVEEAARLAAVRWAGRGLAGAEARAWCGARIGLGLALFEGVFYLGTPAAAFLRVGLSTPSHVLDGWIMGAGWERPGLVLAACVLLHGAWDFGAFMVQDGAAWWGLAIPVALWLQVMLAQELGIRTGVRFPALPQASLGRRLVQGLGVFFLLVAGIAVLGVAAEEVREVALAHLMVGAGLFGGVGMLLLALGRSSPPPA